MAGSLLVTAVSDLINCNVDGMWRLIGGIEDNIVSKTPWHMGSPCVGYERAIARTCGGGLACPGWRGEGSDQDK
jgi:hypothetical protein